MIIRVAKATILVFVAMFITKVAALPPVESKLSPSPASRAISVEQRLAQMELAFDHKLEVLVEEIQALRSKVEVQEHQLKILGQGAAPLSAPEMASPTPVVVPLAPPSAVLQEDPAEQQAYDEAYASLQARDYVAATKLFKEMLEQYPKGKLNPNAYYWLGELYLLENNEAAATEAFQKVVDQYPGHSKVPDSMLKLGYVAYGKGRFSEAFKLLETVKTRFPETSCARLAEARIQRMHQDGQL